MMHFSETVVSNTTLAHIRNHSQNLFRLFKIYFFQFHFSLKIVFSRGFQQNAIFALGPVIRVTEIQDHIYQLSHV